MHKPVDLAVHYWGTPVVLISTVNEDGSTNVAPMSSIWWLGWSCMLGLDASSQTVVNLRRQGQCVVNLCADHNADLVNRLALLTGRRSVPLHKKALGYRYEANKIDAAGMTEQSSEEVLPSRVLQCPVQLEATVVSISPFAAKDPRMAIAACAIELRIEKTHVAEELLTGTKLDRINTDVWRPLFMSFRQLFKMGERESESRLNSGPEHAYAPWKNGKTMAIAGKVMKGWSNARYGKNE